MVAELDTFGNVNYVNNSEIKLTNEQGHQSTAKCISLNAGGLIKNHNSSEYLVMEATNGYRIAVIRADAVDLFKQYTLRTLKTSEDVVIVPVHPSIQTSEAILETLDEHAVTIPFNQPEQQTLDTLGETNLDNTADYF